MAKRKILKNHLNTGELFERIRRRYKDPEWIVLPEVRNATGAVRQERYADAIAINLWPSRGIEVHGFEIKTYRGDWLKELKQPEKAAPIVAKCHRWWIVANKDIVREGELPARWGLMEARGKILRTVVKAPELEPEPLSYRWVASLLRAAAGAMIPRASVQAEISDAFDRGCETSKERLGRAEAELGRVLDMIDVFQKNSGLKMGSFRLSSTYEAERFGQAVHFVRREGAAKVVAAMEHAKITTTLENARGHAQRLVEAIDALKTNKKPETEDAGR